MNMKKWALLLLSIVSLLLLSVGWGWGKNEEEAEDVTQTTICAWCDPPTEQTPEDTSHGICQDHAEQMMISYHWNRLQNTPSYVEMNAAEFAEED